MLFFILGFMNALNSSVFFYMDSSFFTKRSQDQEAVLKTKSRLAESLNESCHNSAKNSAFSEVDKIHSYFLFFSILHSKSLTGSPSALLHATDIKLYLSYTEKKKKLGSCWENYLEEFLWPMDLDYVQSLSCITCWLLPV